MKEKNKNWLKENWFKVGLLAILVIFVAGAFYWYEWKPTKIYSYCNEQAKKATREGIDKGFDVFKNYDYAYKACLRSKGIYK